MRKAFAALVAACLTLLGVVGLAGTATATDLSQYCTSQDGGGELCDLWVTWKAPNYVPVDPTLARVGLPQTFVGFGKIHPTDCGVTYQKDHYSGSREAIEAVLADGQLGGTVAHPEDEAIVTYWKYSSSEPCGLPRDASADVQVSGPTCGADGTVAKINVVNATAGPVVPTGGTHYQVTFTAAPGHLFPAGDRVSDDGTTLVFAFDLLPRLPKEQCVTTIVDVTFPPASPPTCQAGASLPSTPADTDTYTWSWSGNTLTATTRTGYTFASGTTLSTTYTLAGKLPSPSAECPVTVVPSVTVTDVCETANDTVVPVAVQGITYVTSRSGATVTVTASTDEGYVFGVLPTGWSTTEGGTAVFTATLTNTACPTPVLFQAPTLDGTVLNPVCSLDAPYLQGNVVLVDPDNQSTGHTATISLTDGTNTYTYPTAFPLGAFSVLWPGAAVGPDGHGTQWPGYITNADGTYTATTGNFAWTRGPNVHVVVSVNPTLTVAVSYPPSSPTCITTPPVLVPTSAVLAAPGSSGSSAVLAATGAHDVQVYAWAAVLAVLLGSGLLVAVGSRRQRR